MVALTPRFTSLLTFVVSSSMFTNGVVALPQDHHGVVNARGHHHHHHHHHHHGHDHGSGRTKVYADDPLIISGDDNHVHAHLNKHRRNSHGSHHHHGHHNTKVYAGDPLVVSGNGNHVHSHSHKRGLVDPLVPLLSSVPGLPGIIDLVNTVSHAVLSEKLASLIISSGSNGAGAQSNTGDSTGSGFVISASNTSSSLMYLLPQNISTSLVPPEKPVLVTMPMFDDKDKGLKMYCASYDPSPATAIQMSSEPCLGDAAPSNNNSTSPRMSQLFSWNSQSGKITPLWVKDPTQPLVDTTSTPGGGSDPASLVDGYVVGQFATVIDDSQHSSGALSMVFRAIDPSNNPNVGLASAGNEDVEAQSTPTATVLESSAAMQSTETAVITSSSTV